MPTPEIPLDRHADWQGPRALRPEFGQVEPPRDVQPPVRPSRASERARIRALRAELIDLLSAPSYGAASNEIAQRAAEGATELAAAVAVLAKAQGNPAAWHAVTGEQPLTTRGRVPRPGQPVGMPSTGTSQGAGQALASPWARTTTDARRAQLTRLGRLALSSVIAGAAAQLGRELVHRVTR